MNYTKRLLSILLNATFLCLATGSNTITLRGSTDTIHGASNDRVEDAQLEGQDRQKLVKDLTCKLFRKKIEYSSIEGHHHDHSEDPWICSLPKRKKLDGLRLVQLVDADHIVSGIPHEMQSQILTVSEAIIDTEFSTMRIPNGAVYGLSNNTMTRTVAPTMGDLRALVIRVLNADGKGPDADMNKLRSYFFTDGISLSKQYNRCSHGKLRIQPYEGWADTGRYIYGGVVEVKVNYRGDDHGILSDRAMQAATAQLGDLESDKYDLIMFAMPPQPQPWVAYAFGDSKYSFCHSSWCNAVSVQMHETGHNLGLAHSGQLHQTKYDDQTGFMGYSYNEDDTLMCFSPAKSYQLQWYDDQTKSLYPLRKNGDPFRSYKLNGVTDYGKDKEALIILRLVQKNVGRDYYVGFNRKFGINRDTFEDPNEVIIVRKESGGPYEYGDSTKMASLKVGNSHIIRNFDNDRDVEISFVGAGAKNEFAVIDVIDLDRQREDRPQRCKPFVVEVLTDDRPDRNFWTIRDTQNNGRVYARSMVYTKSNAWYTQEICLPYDKQYKFDFHNLNTNGYFRALNEPRTEYLFSGYGNNHLNIVMFNVGQDPDPDLGANGNFDESKKRCFNSREKFLLHNGKWSKRNSCKRIKKKQLCNAEDPNGKPMWENCKKACQRC